MFRQEESTRFLLHNAKLTHSWSLSRDQAVIHWALKHEVLEPYWQNV